MAIKKNILILLLFLLGASYCKQAEPKKDKKTESAGTEKKEKTDENFKSPPSYDLNHPVIFNLQSELDEISGIVYYPKDTSVFAICDDKGWLYKIHLTGKKLVEKWKFSKGEDFEDLVLKDSTFYTLASTGQVTAFRFSNSVPSTFNTYSLNKGGKNEFETLFVDSSSRNLVMLCKDCEGDSKKDVSAFSFDPVARTFSGELFFKLNATEIAEKEGLSKIKFKPSAACINPITRELFIISSVNNALVVADNNGTIKNVYNLDPKIYKQPEGITFTPSGDLLISNESAEIGAANILIFKLKK